MGKFPPISLSNKSGDERMQDAKKYFNEVLLQLPEYGPFTLLDIIKNKLKDHPNYKDIWDCHSEIQTILETHDYIKQGQHSYTRLLTDKGREVKTAGGHDIAIEQQEVKQQLADDIARKQIQQMDLAIVDLVNKVSDYDKVKDRAKWAIIIAALAALGTIVQVVLQLKGK